MVRPVPGKNRLLPPLLDTSELPQDAVVLATAARQLLKPFAARAAEAPVVLPAPEVEYPYTAVPLAL